MNYAATRALRHWSSELVAVLTHLLQLAVLHLDGGVILYLLSDVSVTSNGGILFGQVVTLLIRARQMVNREENGQENTRSYNIRTSR